MLETGNVGQEARETRERTRKGITGVIPRSGGPRDLTHHPWARNRLWKGGTPCCRGAAERRPPAGEEYGEPVVEGAKL